MLACCRVIHCGVHRSAQHLSGCAAHHIHMLQRPSQRHACAPVPGPACPAPQDMRLVWTNCKTYNAVPTDILHKAAARLEGFFEQAWAASGLSIDRTRRTTAGLAAPRFEPEMYDAAAAPARSGGARPPKRRVSRGLGAVCVCVSSPGGGGAPPRCASPCAPFGVCGYVVEGVGCMAWWRCSRNWHAGAGVPCAPVSAPLHAALPY